MKQKIRINYKNNQINALVKYRGMVQFNKAELKIFESNLIRGLFRPIIINEGKINYISAIGTPISKVLLQGISVNDFFIIFTQFIEVLKSVSHYNFNANNLLLNLDYVFINLTTKEVKLIYQPVIGINNAVNVFSFFYSFIDLALFSGNEVKNYGMNLKNFLKQLDYFDIDTVEQYINGVYPQVYNQVFRQRKGHSHFLYEKHMPKESDSLSVKQKSQNDEENTSLLFEEDFNTSLLFEEDASGPDTSLLFEDDEKSYDQQIETDNKNNFNINVNSNDDIQNNDYDGKETTLLEDTYCSAETTVLTDEQMGRIVKFPYLIRISNFDRIEINKPAFRIGKEKSYVDYYVKNNSAVSRVHLDILTKNNNYYVVDNNSTNGTFVNGTSISPNSEYQIYDNDTIMLANEAFEFHVL